MTQRVVGLGSRVTQLMHPSAGLRLVLAVFDHDQAQQLLGLPQQGRGHQPFVQDLLWLHNLFGQHPILTQDLGVCLWPLGARAVHLLQRSPMK